LKFSWETLIDIAAYIPLAKDNKKKWLQHKFKYEKYPNKVLNHFATKWNKTNWALYHKAYNRASQWLREIEKLNNIQNKKIIYFYSNLVSYLFNFINTVIEAYQPKCSSIISILILIRAMWSLFASYFSHHANSERY
jgi:hypothetical protein